MMPRGFGHPPQWDHQLPRVNDLLAPIPPPTRAGTTPTLLPPPNKDPRVSHYVGSQSLARYRSPSASERIPQDRWQDGLQTRSPITDPLGRVINDHDRLSHGLASENPILYPPHFSSIIPIQRQTPGPKNPPYPSFGPVANHALNGNSELRATHSTRKQVTASSASSITPAEQSSWPNPAAATVVESPWGLTKAGKARKRLEQACVNCRKKKTKCEPMNSSSKCLPCEKNGSDCYFDCA
jgi:hypothetical protein